MSLRTAAIIVAAGRGLRAGPGGPKQFRSIGGRTVVAHALDAFCRHPDVGWVQPVCHADDAEPFAAATAGLSYLPPVPGGATRQASVCAGLRALAKLKPDIVLIHDAARPFVSTRGDQPRDRRRQRRLARRSRPLPWPTRSSRSMQAGRVVGTPPAPICASPRRRSRSCSTRILAAHERAARDGRDDFTDDAALAEWAGLTVATFEGDHLNMKLTTPEDFAREEARLGAALGDIRTGTGYDVHAFGDGDHLMICGVRVPHTRGFLAHSDGDVGLHALVDAILGALADGDIGSHFPPTDQKWKGASSDRFLAYAVERVRARGGRVASLEVTLICERPKIGPLARRDARPHRGDCGRAGIPCIGEGDHQRTPWLYRPRGRHGGDGKRDHPPAVGQPTERSDAT